MSTSTITDRLRALLAHSVPFNQLAEADREALLGDLTIEYFSEGALILKQGATQHPGLYVVESGLVRLMDVQSQQLLDMCGEGESFGSFSLIKGGAMIYEAKALEETVCVLLRPGRFKALYEEHEAVAMFYDRDIRRYMHQRYEERDVSGERVLMEQRLSRLVHRRPATCTPETTARQAAQKMGREGVGTLLVLKEERLVGILTRNDLTTRLVARGKSHEEPVQKLMTRGVETIPVGATLFEAMMVMLEEGLHRLVLVEGEGRDIRPVGVLTDRDVTHFRGLDPVATAARIRSAPSVQDLADIRGATSGLLLRLYRQGVRAEALLDLLTCIQDRLVVRVIELVQREMRARSGGQPVEAPWAWMQLGSGGRREVALASEQHNAVVYVVPDDADEAARVAGWFDQLAERVNAHLEEIGLPTSEVVAHNAAWRRSLREWKKAYRFWIHQANEEALAHVPFFFDLRCLFGDCGLVDTLRQDLVDALNVQAMDPERQLLIRMAENALRHRTPVSFFGRFVLERSGDQRGALDVRERGIVPVVDAARVLALDLRYVDSASTFDRLRHAGEAMPDLGEVLLAAQDAYQYLVTFRLEHQLRAVEAGEDPANTVDPARISREQRQLLRSAFSAVEDLQDAVAEHYGVRRRLFS